MIKSSSRCLTQPSESIESGPECTENQGNSYQDRAWQVINRTLIDVWTIIDRDANQTSNSLLAFFKSIMKTPMQFIQITVPQCHCCNAHRNKKTAECLAFDTWFFGRLLFILGRKNLSAVHDVALEAQVQILNLLFSTRPSLFMCIIKFYLQFEQDLVEVERGNVSQFPLVLRHFTPSVETFRDVELDLSPCYIQIHNITDSHHLLFNIFKVLSSCAAGIVGLDWESLQPLWGSICHLLHEGPTVLLSASVHLAAQLIDAGGPPKSMDGQVNFWQRLWVSVQALLIHADLSSERTHMLDLIKSLKSLVASTCQRMYLVGPLEQEVLLTTVFILMQSPLSPAFKDDLNDSVSLLAREVLKSSSEWRLDKCSSQRIVDNFNNNCYHALPGLKCMILQELQQYVACVQKLYKQNSENQLPDYTLLQLNPHCNVSVLDNCPTWRHLWKRVLLASNKLNQVSVPADWVLKEFKVCKYIFELCLEVTADLENLHLRRKSNLVLYIFFGDCLTDLINSIVLAVHHCRPSISTSSSCRVLEEAVKLLGIIASLPEAQENNEGALAMIYLPWMNSEETCFEIEKEHVLHQIRSEFKQYLNTQMKQLCLSQLVGLTITKHLKWVKQIIQQSLSAPDLFVSAVPVIPWLLVSLQHPVTSDELLPLLSPVFQVTESVPEAEHGTEQDVTGRHLILAKTLGQIVCSLSGNCVIVRKYTGDLTRTQRQLLCLACHHEDWLNRPFPYTGSFENQLLCLSPLLRSSNVEVRRAAAKALPTLAGHLSQFRHYCELDSWTPLLLDEDREVRLLFAEHARWLVFDGCWLRGKERQSKEAGNEFLTLSQVDRRELSAAEPLLGQFLDALMEAGRATQQRRNDPRRETIVLTVRNIGCIALDCVLLPSLIQLLLLTGRHTTQAALVSRSIREIASVRNVSPKDLFNRFKPELCKTIVLTASWWHSGKNGFINILTNLMNLFDMGNASTLILREKGSFLPPLIADVLLRPSVSCILNELADFTNTSLKDLLRSSFQHIYPYIVLNESKDLLAKFIEFFQSECQIEDINVFMAPFLTVIHNELLLHFNGHRDRVLDSLQVLANIDPTFKNPGTETLSEEQIADFLQPRFLGVLIHLESCLTSDNAPETVKVQALQCVPELIRLMGPKHISVVRFKVLATLRIALQLNHANFPHLTIAAWNAFVHSLDDSSLGSLMSTIFASLLPLLDSYPNEVASIFDYIVVEKMEDLWIYYKELYFVPEHPALTNVVALIKKSSNVSNHKNGVYSEIKEKLMYVVHNNVDVRLHAVRFLRGLISEFHVQLHEAIVKHERVEPCVIEMLNKLTEACKDPDQRVKIAAAECLGKLGAVDPGILPQRKCLSGSSFFTTDVDNSEFTVYALTQLVKGFQDATDRRTVDAFSVSIQDLLKVYKVKLGGSLWNSFAPNVQDIMRPLLHSSYKCRIMPTASSVTPIYGSELGTNLQEWATNWSLKLISGMVEERPRQIFESCVLALVVDLGAALFFLPYILLHALVSARDPERMETEILQEFEALLEAWEPSAQTSDGCVGPSGTNMMETLREEQYLLAVGGRAAAVSASLRGSGTIVASSGSKSNQFVYTSDQIRCSRTAFQLLDFLWHWVRRVRMHNKKDARLSDNSVTTRVQDFLNKLCKLRIAKRNFECQEHARALLYLEQYIKEKPTELQNHLWFFEELYVNLDDPDAVAGTLCIQGREPSLKQLARAHEATGQYQNAAACYEQTAHEHMLDPEQVKGMIHCYLCLDQPFTALKIAEGVTANRPEVALDINEQYAECLWRLHEWDQLDEFVASPELANNTAWGVQIGRALLLLREVEHKKMCSVLDTTLSAVVEHLSLMDRQQGMYFHGYDYIVKLHVLHEMKQASEVLASVLEFSESGVEYASRELLSNLLDEWEKRIHLVKKAAGTLEPILCLRRIVLEQAFSHLKNNDPELGSLLTREIGKCWLRSAKAARKEGHYQRAFMYVLQAQKYQTPALFIEKAHIYWEKGDQQSAFSTLHRGIEEHFPDAARFKGTTDQRDRRLLYAKARLLIAQYNEQRLKVDSEESKEQYTSAVEACEQWEKPLVELARFFHKKFQNIPDSEKDIGQGAQMQIAMVNYLGKSLKYGTKYIYESMPRMLTLWLDYGNNSNTNRHLTHDYERHSKEITDCIESFSECLPPYLFYTAFSQLVSRICHQNNAVLKQLRSIIVNIVVAYPQQSLWMLMGSLKSCYSVRAKRCQEILQQPELRRPGANLSQLVSHYNMLTDQLIELTNKRIDSTNVTLRTLAPQLSALLTSSNFSEVVVPVDLYMKYVLPTSGVSKNHVAFPQKLIYLQSIKEKVTVLNSLQQPRKITFIGSDGLPYDIMCKPKDDLRKDFRMMEFNAVVNRLLHKDPQSRQRELHIRTYSVVPLNEECGLVEWLPNLVCLRPLLIQLYRQAGVRHDLNKIKEMLNLRNDMAKYQREVKQVIDMHPPLLSRWFLITFPDAASWYLARTSYVRTCAVMSMVGYIVGLGDRHGENLLLDEGTGEIVHVDFNCLFNKGESFEWPEVVPFRLTQNMVEAMGPLGTEGPFRRVCEATLVPLRAQAHTLMSVLRPFLYDPLIAWKKPSARRTGHALRDHEMTNELALQNLQRIERRLRGGVRVVGKTPVPTLSAEGQANSLIAEATSLNNLCRMYIGWGPYF